MLKLLHTNDLHGALTPARVARLKELRGDADLYFDSGDAVGRPAGQGLDEDRTTRALESLRCDAMCPGNHEFLLLPFGEVPPLVLCANLLDRREKPIHVSRTFATPFGRVGVIGITTPWIKFTDRSLKRLAACADAFEARFVVTPPFETAAREVARLRSEVETLVVLSHLGSRGDAKLAGNVEGIDILLGAHTHETIPPTRLGTTWYAQSGAGATSAGRYDWDGTTLAGEAVPL